MSHERDERWAYVALAMLVVAYIAYRYATSSGLEGFSVRLPDLNLGRFGKSLPYLFAPLFAVLSEFLRRKKARATREMWERASRAEGFLRGEEGLKIRFVEGGRGSIEGDVRLTRAALYVLDKGARRDPMRFVFARTDGSDPAVLDVALRDGSSPELRRVRVSIGDSKGNRFAMEFESREGEAWRSSLRHALGRSGDVTQASEPPSEVEPSE